MAGGVSESSLAEFECESLGAAGSAGGSARTDQRSARNHQTESALLETRDHGKRGYGECGSGGVDVQATAFAGCSVEYRRLRHRIFFAQLPAPVPAQLPEDRSLVCH